MNCIYDATLYELFSDFLFTYTNIRPFLETDMNVVFDFVYQ